MTYKQQITRKIEDLYDEVITKFSEFIFEKLGGKHVEKDPGGYWMFRGKIVESYNLFPSISAYIDNLETENKALRQEIDEMKRHVERSRSLFFEE